MPLQLIPNELVGYRFKPDWYSVTVVMVKRHGPNSKNFGQEYETVLAYCKNVEFAANWLFEHVVKVQSELNQKEALAATGSVADTKAMLVSFGTAKAEVLAAAAQLQARIDTLGLNKKQLVQALGGTPPDGE